jgi:A/G-specific adenine glycosylase
MVHGDLEAGPRDLQAIADASVPADRPGDWTHAVMDVGATFCRPARPDCARCPARQWCRFAAAPVERPGHRRVSPSAPAFRSTARWLRGRLVDRLRDADDGTWVRLAESVGDHDEDAVARAVESLHREGFLERHAEDPRLVRLPLG